MDKKETCCFTGHRNISKELYENILNNLKNEVEKLINNGVKNFLAGGAIGFDTLAAQAVLSLKNKYPQINLIMVLPCQNQSLFLNEQDVKIYEEIKTKCNKIVYISEKYTKWCMFKRNRYMVDNSNYCICYLTEEKGGTAYTVKYAEKSNLKIVYLAK